MSQNLDRPFYSEYGARDELQAQLARCGFTGAVFFGAYDAGVQAGATDRLVVVAQRPGTAA